MKSKHVEPDRLTSIDETALCLGLSKWTVRDWIKRGLITSHKLGSRRLIPVSEVIRLIEESRKPATQER
jgi:excisionase family DNA binding protein